MDDDIYADLEKRYCHYGDDEFIDEQIEAEPRQKKPGKLFGLFALAGMTSGRSIPSRSRIWRRRSKPFKVSLHNVRIAHFLRIAL